MTRSFWKCNIINNKLYSIIKKLLKNKKIIKKFENKNIYIKTRNLNINKIFLNHTFNIYNGKSYVKVKIRDYMLNNKYGRYSFSKHTVKHKLKKKSQKVKKSGS